MCWKDLFFFLFLCMIGFLELYFGFMSLSHPDNAFEVNMLVTPLHIVPEWYLLEFYAFLKGMPNKNSGFMIMLSSILCLFIYGESSVFNVLIFSSVYTVYSYIISMLFMMGYYMWIGSQLPQNMFILYGRLNIILLFNCLVYY